jgi:hypothetical protein
MEQALPTLPPTRLQALRALKAAQIRKFSGYKAWTILLLALALTVLEGAIRKWVIGSEANRLTYVAYFSKDILFAALLLFPARANPSRSLIVFSGWVLPGCFLLITGAFFSANREFNLVGACLTLRASVLLPLLAMVAVRRLVDLPFRGVVWLLTGLAILNCWLGIMQNRLPADHILNRYAAETTNIVAVESGVRATGTFAYITGLGLISSVGIWAGMVLLSIARNRWDRAAGLAAILGGFGCGLASVSRGPVVTGAIMMGIWLIFPRAGFSVLSRSLAVALVVIALCFSFGLSPIFSRLWGGVQQRHDAHEDTFEDRAFGQVQEGALALKTAPMGKGLGTEQVGGNYYSGGEMTFGTFEYQLPRLVLETGIFGLIGFLCVCSGALLALHAARTDAQTKGMKAAILATQLLLLPMLYTNVVFNHTASAFAWIIFAAMLAASVERKFPTNQKTTPRRSQRGFARRPSAAT